MEFNPFSLQDKTILVTGASSGIGQAIAVMCSKMGASLVITGRNQNKLQNTFSQLDGKNNSFISADLTQEEDIQKLAEECPTLDGVVHSAGLSKRILTQMISEEDIEDGMNANFRGPVLLQKQLLRKKKIKKSASIVMIASRAPFAPSVGYGIYAASKGALIAYSKVLALELASKLIRVNCICPGMVWTDLVKREAESLGVDYTVIEKEYPLKRFGQPDDVAALAVYMLSDASAWMTGSIVDLTGGGELTLK